MKCLELAAFTSDLPDDQVEDDGEIIQFGGQGVSRVIAQVLRDAGYEVEEPEHMFEMGWEFQVKGGQQLSLRVSDLGDFFILQSIPGPFRASGPSPRDFHTAVVRTVTEALSGDGRFHDLLWFEAMGDDHGFTDPVMNAAGSVRVEAPAAWKWKSWRGS